MTSDRSRTIDGLRGIAAMAVIVQHCLEFTPIRNAGATLATPVSYIFSNDFNFGRFGVMVFFLISGFLIPSSIVNQPRPLLSFVVGRFFRLYPLYWLSIAAALVVGFFLNREMPGGFQILANVTMLQKAMGIENILDPYWTLFVEHLFYASCVVLFLIRALHSERSMRLIAGLSGIFLVAVAIGVAVAPTSPNAKYGITLINYPSFLFAMIVGHNIRLAQGSAKTAPLISIAALYFAVFFAGYFAREAFGGFVGLLSSMSVFSSSIGAFLFFLLALRTSFLSSRSFAFVGKISYGLYLFHAISLWVGIALVGRPYDISHSLLLIGLVIAMTFVTSTITFYFVEEPSISFGKTVRRSLGSQARFRAKTRPINVIAEDTLQPFDPEAQPTDP